MKKTLTQTGPAGTFTGTIKVDISNGRPRITTKIGDELYRHKVLEENKRLDMYLHYIEKDLLQELYLRSLITPEESLEKTCKEMGYE